MQQTSAAIQMVALAKQNLVERPRTLPSSSAGFSPMGGFLTDATPVYT